MDLPRLTSAQRQGLWKDVIHTIQQPGWGVTSQELDHAARQIDAHYTEIETEVWQKHRSFNRLWEALCLELCAHIVRLTVAWRRQQLLAGATAPIRLEKVIEQWVDKEDQAQSQLFAADQLRELARKIHRGLDYAEYRKTAHWQELQGRALERAKGRCGLCNAMATNLEVHHRTYQRLGHEEEGDLVVLCHACRGNLHDKLPA